MQEGESILYTYDVIWRESQVGWSSRWDVYLNEDHLVPAQVHWYSITNSILVVLFLSLLIVSILVRNLRRDIAGYNALSMLAEDEEGEKAKKALFRSGKKQVHQQEQEGTNAQAHFKGDDPEIGRIHFTPSHAVPST